MYKVIKSAIIDNRPHVVKAPESLFIIKAEAENDTSSEAGEKKTDELQIYQDEVLELQQEIDKISNEIQNKQIELEQLEQQQEIVKQQTDEYKTKLEKEAQENRDKTISEAQNQAEIILKEAQETGYKQGHTDGYDEGLTQYKEQNAHIIIEANQKAERIILTAQEDVAQYWENAENDLIDLVMEVSGKVIPQQFMDMPQMILPVIQTALEKVKNQTSIDVKVSNDSFEFALAAKAELQSMLSGNVKLNIKADDSLQNGDCWIETADGSIDAKLSSQLAEMEKSLRKVVGKHETDTGH